MSKVFADAIEIDPPGPARGSVIWLHGLGANGHDFEPLVRQWDLTERLSLRFVLPHAPVRPVTLNAGRSMRAWYDVSGLEFGTGEDVAGIRAAQQDIRCLIEQEQARGLDARSILLAGFSQGGALALFTGLRYPQPLAGILGLSCYLPLAATLEAEKQDCQLQTPIRMDHGEMDPIVALRLAEVSCARIRSAGFDVAFNLYAMGHSLCLEQIPELYRWIAACFGVTNASSP